MFDSLTAWLFPQWYRRRILRRIERQAAHMGACDFADASASPWFTLPPWFTSPPRNQAQREVLELVGQEIYQALVTTGRVIVVGNAGGRWVLYRAGSRRRALPGVYYAAPGRERLLCIDLSPDGGITSPGGQTALPWEDHWQGLIRWIRCDEAEVLRRANIISSGPQQEAWLGSAQFAPAIPLVQQQL